ncbi:MAG: hypothetical protein A2086_12090 [Spirochaetes bacterium GWD1_27_9]|nr:MAG: hypothetical protein A2Z98_03040 [Spirochaetes bacterium GWB1_27_13]OHD22929.1 MAG: hypothetical protein A2Y34_09150 [Spirochaetes bacterium GWC1_27_15]OHD28971.1 MAG: hypothetical protein A2086_12090 [Spirochaetes bacterium GWD1_27_9]
MKNNKYFLIILFIFTSFLAFSDATDDSIVSKISRTDIKIGEKINLLIKIPNLKDVKILWEDLSYADSSVDIIDKKDFYKDKYLNIEINFTFFNPGEYKKFYFTIPISQKDGEMMYLTTDYYDISVKSTLTPEELETINKTEDPQKIVLRNEKTITDIPFTFKPYIIPIIIILGCILAGFVIYFIVYKILLKRKGKEVERPKLPPYQQFLSDIAKIDFKNNDARLEIENKLSILTETLKELIYREFDLNAPSETTRELITSLRQIDFNSDLIVAINTIFTEIDMIKFAKAEFQFDRLIFFLNIIKDFGQKVHNYYNEKNPQEVKK